MNFESSLAKLISGESLSEREARNLFEALLKNKLPESKAKNLLLLLARKGETMDEVLGCLAAIRHLEGVRRIRIPHLMDTCGTGGDQSHSFNISTVAAFVIAGAGGKVAKHGNRAISSKSGSSDLVEALGVRLNASPSRMVTAIRKYGIGYFHAPYYHPTFARLQPLRKKLGARTVFNFLGPILNPIRLDAQLIGVAKPELVPLLTSILKKSGMRSFLVCHSLDGLDEITTSAPTRMGLSRKGRLQFFTLNPQKLGFAKARKGDYAGGSPSRNREITVKLLQGGMKGPLRDVVVLNAAAGLYVSGLARDWKEAIHRAKHSINSGKAYKALQGLRKLTRAK